MSSLFKNKFIIIIIVCTIIYWVKNPASEFGFSKKGLVIFNRIPILLFDCYISPEGKLHLESDLSKPVNINYWIMNHLTLDDGKGERVNSLIVGTGFDSIPLISFTEKQKQKLRSQQIKLEYYPSRVAIKKYNKSYRENKKTAILLKIMK